MNHFRSESNPIFIIAEIGGNHEGDLAYAQHLVDLALGSGVDAVKLQIYTGDTLVSRVESPDRNAHFKRFELGVEPYRDIAGRCAAAGVQFMASIWNLEYIDLFDPFIRIHKVGSGDLTSYPMLRRLAATGKPIVLSTGLASMPEIVEAVSEIVAVDSAYRDERKLALLQCTSSYPCPPEDVNLAVMHTLRAAFSLPIGYSDHTVGTEAAYAAAAMGADILELHFTDQPEGREFRDHQVSFTAKQMQSLIERVRYLKSVTGSGHKEPTPSERTAGHPTSFRRSVYAARPIAAGEILSEENLTILRPEHGVPASRYYQLLGRQLGRALGEHEVLRDEDLLPEGGMQR
jgi:N,N'-diacetyllegionaminate synthase